jgi:glycosyltransferase involved in cell wall biosynthesis
MVLLEAQAAGVPVIATRVGGIPETIDEGHTGLLVAPADAQGLALSMQELLADPVRRAAMAAQARSRVGQHFLVSRMIESHAQLYGDLLR